MDTWSRGRVVAASATPRTARRRCPGRAPAWRLLGAYVLAGELSAADDDHERAFAGYESTLRRHVLDTQALAFEDSSDDATWWERFYPVVNSFTPKDYPGARTR